MNIKEILPSYVNTHIQNTYGKTCVFNYNINIASTEQAIDTSEHCSLNKQGYRHTYPFQLYHLS